jgi:hypothetical protein
MALPFALNAQRAPTAALAGTIRDTLGHPIRMVAVMVDSGDVTAVTDDSGRFHLSGIRPGKNGFAMRKVGFGPVEFETTLEPGRTLVIDIRMKQLTTLAAVNVTATGPVGLHREGFYEREKVGLGSYIHPAKIDSLSNLMSASQMVMGTLARGVRRACPPRGGNTCDISFRSAACRWLFVDGLEIRDMVFDDAVQPADIAAIEIYDRTNLVPAEFQGRMPESRSGGRMLSRAPAGCAAIVVWTKNRVKR